MTDLFDRACEGARSVLARTERRPRVAMILGSGLGAFAQSLEDAQSIPYAEIPGFAATTVSGHDGTLVLGRVGGVEVAVMSGRLHAYEGHGLEAVTLPVRVLRQMGVRYLVVTNSSGGINPAFGAGTMMLISDHINMFGSNPLVGHNDERFGTRFPDMSYAYDPELRAEMRATAAELGVRLEEGVYVGVMGPSYETPAEIRMFGRMGADAVGMSTVPEVIVANHGGLRVVGVSCVANPAAGLEEVRLLHDDVKAAVDKVSAQFVALLRRFVERLGDDDRFDQGAPDWMVEVAP